METFIAPDRRRLRGAILLALALDAGLWAVGYLTLGRGITSVAGVVPSVLVLTLEDPPPAPLGSRPPEPALKPAKSVSAKLGREKSTVAAPTQPATFVPTEPLITVPQSPAPPVPAATPDAVPPAPALVSPGAPVVLPPEASAAAPPTAIASRVSLPAETATGSVSPEFVAEGGATDPSRSSVPEGLSTPVAAWGGSALANPSPGGEGTAGLSVQRDTSRDTSQERSRETLYGILNRLIKERLTYPPLAKQRNIQGVVGLTVVVSPQGKLLSLTLGQSSQSSILDRAAKELVETLFPLPNPPVLETDQTMLIQVRYILTL